MEKEYIKMFYIKMSTEINLVWNKTGKNFI